MKTWMVEQQWAIRDGIVVSVRGVVKAPTRAAASKKAPGACRKAMRLLSISRRLTGKPVADPVVLYPIGGVA